MDDAPGILAPTLPGSEKARASAAYWFNEDVRPFEIECLTYSQPLESCNLHTVLDCPGGSFQGAGVKTVVLFFEKGAPTRKIWYDSSTPAAISARRIR